MSRGHKHPLSLSINKQTFIVLYRHGSTKSFLVSWKKRWRCRGFDCSALISCEIDSCFSKSALDTLKTNTIHPVMEVIQELLKTCPLLCPGSRYGFDFLPSLYVCIRAVSVNLLEKLQQLKRGENKCWL